MGVVIRLAEPKDWEAVRDIRLRMLREEPDAYASEYQTEARFEPGLWKHRLATASSYLAFDDDQALVGIATGLDSGDGDIFVVGMYVVPGARAAQGVPTDCSTRSLTLRSAVTESA